MVESMMQAHDILPRHVARIDVTTGGDHGTSKGAFQQGIHMAMVVKDKMQLKTPDDDDDKAVTGDSIVAEVICKKDNEKVLELVCVCVSGLTVVKVFPIMGFHGVTQAVLLSQQGAILR